MRVVTLVVDDGKQTLELYKIIVEEEHFFLAEHQKRIAFFTGSLSAVLALTIGGLLRSADLYQVGILFIGGVLLVAVSKIAKSGTLRIYQRFLETVTVRAKLETDLGFAEARSKATSGWVECEPLSPVRHLDSRTNEDRKSSTEWVKDKLAKKENYHGVSRALFSVTQYMGVALISLSAVLVCVNVLKATLWQ